MEPVSNMKLINKSNQPIIISINDTTSDFDSIKNIIKPIESEIDTLGSANKTKIIKDIDTISNEEFVNKYLAAKVINTSDLLNLLNSLSESEIEQITKQELRIRNIENERRLDFNQAISDETIRRDLFKREITVKKLELQLYMKQNYKEFVGDRFISDGTEKKVKSEITIEKDYIIKNRNELISKKVDRLDREHRRKKVESSITVNPIIERMDSLFFEEDVLIERRQKLQINPELQGITKIQSIINDVRRFELEYGKSVIPHRDVVDSDESDFDSNSITKSDDMLIITDTIKSTRDQLDKNKMLIELKLRLDGNPSEPDFSSLTASPRGTALVNAINARGTALVNAVNSRGTALVNAREARGTALVN
jgi:hypothetical protein